MPKVLGLAECLREWLDHLRDVLVRRSNYRKGQIENRLEVLGGYLIAYLNIDKVIKIIRTEDEPKPVLMKTFKLTDVQADAILNMRLRSLAQARGNGDPHRGQEPSRRVEGHQGGARLRKPSSGRRSASRSARSATCSGRRRRSASAAPQFADAPEHDLAAIEEALVEREPITVVVSDKGWVRTLKGHVAGPLRA